MYVNVIILVHLKYIYVAMKKPLRFIEICGCLGGTDQMTSGERSSFLVVEGIVGW